MEEKQIALFGQGSVTIFIGLVTAWNGFSGCHQKQCFYKRWKKGVSNTIHYNQQLGAEKDDPEVVIEFNLGHYVTHR